MLRKIFKTGHSAAVSLDRGIMKEVGLKEGDSVRIEVDKEGQQITIRHGKKENQLALGFKVRKTL